MPTSSPELGPTPEPVAKDPEVHTLPEKFLRPGSTSKKPHTPLSPLRKGVIILGVVVALLVLGAYLLLAVFNSPASSPTENENAQMENLNVPLVNVETNENAAVGNGNDNINSSVNVNGILANLNINGGLNENSNLNGSNNTNENINGSTNENINTNTNSVPSLPSTQDTDADGLTDQEEALYGTNDNLKDTDGDGFVDGLEVMNGYSPLFAPGSTLVSVDGVSVYANVTHTFSVNYPKNWVVDARTANEILFITSTTEFIEVLVEQKRSTQTISDWYDDQVSVGGATDLTLTDVNGLPTLISKNGLTYYIGDEDKVFVMTYNFGTREAINFRTSYYMMLDSFARELREAPVAPSGTNSNTNAKTNINQNSNQNVNANRNSNVNVPTNSNQNKNQNTNQNKNANSNKNRNSNTAS